jgi:hypothetical protein
MLEAAGWPPEYVTAKVLAHLTCPELTGEWKCQGCGNTTHWIGYDDFGYPGAGCECGAWDDDSEEGKECTCLATLRQAFQVLPNGELDYHEFTPADEDAEIGEYTRINCAACGEQLWAEPPEPEKSEKVEASNG